MSDEEYLVAIRKAREESVRFFNSNNKAERERWVANEFLLNLGESFDESELLSVADDPPDIKFRSAAFEIKEIQDKGRLRHAEYKADLAVAKAATSAKDLLKPVTPRDITYTEVCDRIEEEVNRYANKYSAEVRAKLDLLFYVNLEDVYGYIDTPLPPSAKWEQSGFRSVCLIMGRLAGVLMASEDAPDFLKTGAPRVVIRQRAYGRG